MHAKHEVTDLGVGEEHNEEHDREGHDVSETLESKHFKYPSLLKLLFNIRTRSMVPESWDMVLLNEMYLKTLIQPTYTVRAAAS